MKKIYLALSAIFILGACNAGAIAPPIASQNCFVKNLNEAKFDICKFDPKLVKIQILLDAPNIGKLGTFSNVSMTLKQSGKRLVFAMNGGMYLENRDPVGLLVIDGEIRKKLFTGKATGNFGLKPNGVFYVNKDGAGVLETGAYKSKFGDEITDFATQSGPMLVTNGQIHPKFIANSENVNIRNAVGVDENGMVYFVISRNPTTFHTMATLFKDQLKTQNALYLDGSVSKIYSTELGRNDMGDAMGPIIAVCDK